MRLGDNLLRLRSPQNIMGTNSSQEAVIFMYLKGKTIEHSNTCLPSILISLKLFDTQRGMADIFQKEFYLFLKYLVDMIGEVFEVFIKGVGSGYLHALRSVKSSFTDENAFILPSRMSSSASFSAVSQSKFLKYGGIDNAYLSNLKIAVSSSGRFVLSLKASIPSIISSGISNTILRDIFMNNLSFIFKNRLSQHQIEINMKGGG